MENQYQRTVTFENYEWTDICKPDKTELEKIAALYQLDYFQIRDSVQPGHLPKIEKQDNYTFIVLRAFTADLTMGATTVPELSNKIAFFFNNKKLITIHATPFDFLELGNKKFKHAEELLLHIIYKMVDTYQEPFDELDKKIGDFEKTIFLKDYSKVSVENLYFLKAQARITKKLLQFFQNVINQMEVKPQQKTALQNIKDHLLSMILNYDEVLEDANNLLNSYHSVNAQKNNDVMKLLTIFSAFFLPLTFIAGIYGMNFENMPELEWHWGYFLTLALMLLVSVIIFIWFKRKKII
ncbi:magnesium transporter [Sphingobacterium allocomposti]|uniref:Magnesium transporter n=1 Tax=Sphingobacterium allocomposti TaxID=415956 RepID=A0A5S5DAW2_9SPHI|nr:CorA family divalent cation transporter [Sphingobacterium composti Yoo et al. 2007 non Ten et al. 2007]TYP92256.1 magnesium transporter [Sphingobacterium composti Yoo et al. 2007 non Ten et al. 2007]